MNRVEFLAELEQRLSGIPEEERQAAIQYYADYLADAGEENEAEAIRELGNPEKVAESIKADYFGTEFDESRFDHKDYMKNTGSAPAREQVPAAGPAAGQEQTAIIMDREMEMDMDMETGRKTVGETERLRKTPHGPAEV